MNKYIILCREGSVRDIELNNAYGTPCLGIAYGKDEQDAIKKVISYHRLLATLEGTPQNIWCSLIAYKLADDTDVQTAPYLIK